MHTCPSHTYYIILAEVNLGFASTVGEVVVAQSEPLRTILLSTMVLSEQSTGILPTVSLTVLVIKI